MAQQRVVDLGRCGTAKGGRLKADVAQQRVIDLRQMGHSKG